MEKYKRYYGIIVFVVIVAASIYMAYNLIIPTMNASKALDAEIAKKTTDAQKLEGEVNVIKEKLKQIKDSMAGSMKKVYSPVESDLGNDTLFFTLYNDVIEMVHANSVKIRSIDYIHNPESDAFVAHGEDKYFVCDVNMELVSNYTNLGKLIQDIYQYPYYIKINKITVNPYERDKKILITNMSLRLYAHTSPEEDAAPAIGDFN